MHSNLQYEIYRAEAADRIRGDEIAFAGLVARVARVSPESPRLVDVRFDRAGAPLLAALYAHGRPVQYAYLPEPLALSRVPDAVRRASVGGRDAVRRTRR